MAAGVVAVTAVYDRATRPEPLGMRPANSFAYRHLGKRLPLPGFQPRDAVATIVLFVSKNCTFCTESVPFYQRLAAVRSASSGRLRMVAAVPQATETAVEARTYFAQRGIILDEALPAPFRAIGLMATPTLILVGHDGIITDVWTGKLTTDNEAGVLGRIQTVCSKGFPIGARSGPTRGVSR